MSEIRTSTDADRDAILRVVADAFGGGKDELDIVRKVWDAPEYLPDLDLVAVVDGEVVGHALHSTGHVDGRPLAAALAPLAVASAHQGRGLGSALMREAIARADAARIPMIVLLGNPAYYGRFGFGPAREIGIVWTGDVHAGPDPFQALRLDAWDESMHGTFRYCFDD